MYNAKQNTSIYHHAPCDMKCFFSFLVWLNPTIFPLLFEPLQTTKWGSDKKLEPQFSNSYPLIAAMQPFIQDQSHTKHSSWMAQAITERMCLSVFKAASIMCAAWPRAPCTPQPRWLPWQLRSFFDLPQHFSSHHYVSLKTYILM